MKTFIRIISALLSLMFAISLFGCINRSKTAAVISAINEDGSMQIEDTEGNKYIMKPYDPGTYYEPAATGIIYLKNFGAKGDGVNDDTEAIKLAVAALKDGGILYLQQGTYIMTSPIEISTDNIIIKGDGAKTVIEFKYDPKQDDKASGCSAFCFENAIKNVILKDFTVKHTDYDENVAAVKQYGILFGQCDNVYLDNLTVSGFNASAVRIGSDTETESTRISIKNSRFFNNNTAGIEIGKADGIDITACDIYENKSGKSCTGYGVYAPETADAKNVRINFNRINKNYIAGVFLKNGKQVIIDGNIISNNSLYGVYAKGENTDNIIISNNMISDMEIDSVDSFSDYDFLSAICCGTECETSSDRRSYSIMNNTVKNITLKKGSSYGIFSAVNDCSTLKITDNQIEIDRCTSAIFLDSLKKDGYENNETDIGISSNQIHLLSIEKALITLCQARKLSISKNIAYAEKSDAQEAISMTGSKKTQTTITENIIALAGSDMKLVSFENGEAPSVIINKNNIFNGAAE
ncbi:MAG: right-handed parallel beta-helix repeat-containing protein [Oscillospiraceae bacterium]|nr:right-handed parallel beta-helix repeat-containing protein [Oscillospiraceae bacterium]